MHTLHHYLSLLHHPTSADIIVLVGVVAVVASVLFLLGWSRPTTIFSIGIALEAFSGNWRDIPLPLPLDRVAFLVALLVLFARGTAAASDRRIVFRPIHFLLLAIAVYVLLNGLNAGTIEHSYGFYSWLDRLGAIPFLMFTLGPIIFGNHRQRHVLLVTMVVLGAYLGFTALAEGAKVTALVFPRYIENQALGITQGRARGPFLASDAMGLALFDCAALAIVAAVTWTSRRARWVAWAVAAVDLVGIFFTLTRSIWLGAIVALLVTMGAHPRLRRRLPHVAAAGVVVVVVFLVGVPGLITHVDHRLTYANSVYDRYNTYTAAIRAMEAHPIFGIGWQTFETVGQQYFRQSGTYPLTGLGLEVHDVFLSHLAEIGIPAACLWLLALLTSVGRAALQRGPRELEPWRYALLAMFIVFVSVATFSPLSYALPNLMIWMMAGIVARDRLSAPRAPAGVFVVANRSPGGLVLLPAGTALEAAP